MTRVIDVGQALARMDDQVREFHRDLGSTIGDTPSVRDVELRSALIREEVAEAIEALEQDNLPNLARELADMLYVACGTAVACGIGYPSDVMSLWLEIAPAMASAPLRGGHALEIDSAAAACIAALDAGDIERVQDTVGALCVLGLRIAAEHGYDPLPVFDAVHGSNMARISGPVRADGKRLKPAGWQPPDVAAVLRAGL